MADGALFDSDAKSTDVPRITGDRSINGEFTSTISLSYFEESKSGPTNSGLIVTVH
jgi:hypothetical protein